MSGAHADSERPRPTRSDAKPRVVDAWDRDTPYIEPESGRTMRGRHRARRPLLAAAAVVVLLALLIAVAG